MGLGQKIKTSLSLDREVLEWIDMSVEKRRFASRTHAIEYALELLRRMEEPKRLLIRCKTCGVTFSSGIGTTPISFLTLTLSNNIHVCPNGHTNPCSNDYFLER